MNKGGVVMSLEQTARYVRIRVRNPRQFIWGSLRTHDVGRRGFTKRIAGRLKRSGRWATQAWLISREEAYLKGNTIYTKGKDVAEKVRRIRDTHGLKFKVRSVI
jgi:hypothetical protein